MVYWVFVYCTTRRRDGADIVVQLGHTIADVDNEELPDCGSTRWKRKMKQSHLMMCMKCRANERIYSNATS